MKPIPLTNLHYDGIHGFVVGPIGTVQNETNTQQKLHKKQSKERLASQMIKELKIMRVNCHKRRLMNALIIVD
jgi:hypothetical protein